MLLFQLIDGLLMAAMSVHTVLAMGYVFVMWSIRRNFFITLRSPVLACLSGVISNLRGVSATLQYFITWDSSGPKDGGIVDIVGLPAVFLGAIIHVLRAIRVLLMYHPRKRKAWGGVPREKKILKIYAMAYVLLEIMLWSAAAVLGISRAAEITASTMPPAAILTALVAALWLGFQLGKVDDMCSLGRESLQIGGSMLGVAVIYGSVQAVPMSALAFKYADVFPSMISYLPIIWVMNVAPIREMLKNADSTRPGPGGFYLVYGIMPWRTGGHATRRVVASSVVPVSRRYLHSQDYSGFEVHAKALDSVMCFPPVWEAFGEYCRKALCIESYNFLVDVNDFKHTVHATSDPRNEDATAGEDFDKFLAIVKEYIEVNSCSEVNIDDHARHRVLKYTEKYDFIALSRDQRSEVFYLAEKQISDLLADNLLAKFKATATYKELVDDEEEKPPEN